MQGIAVSVVLDGLFVRTRTPTIGGVPECVDEAPADRSGYG